LAAGTLSAEVVGTVLAIFLLLLVGYLAKCLGVLRTSDSTVINSLLLNFTLPAFIFMAFRGVHLSRGQAFAPVAMQALQVLLLALAYIGGRAMKLDRRTTGGLMMAAAFGNTGFLGYPVTVAAFPTNRDALPTAVVIDEFGMALALYTVGIVVASAFGGSRFDWSGALTFLKMPSLLATVAGLLLRSYTLPQPLLSALSYLGAATVPLAMISLGLMLTGSSIAASVKPAGLVVLLKMGVAPLLMHFAMTTIGANPTVHDVAVLQAAMPSAILTGIFSARYGSNAAFVATAVFLTTILSIPLIPVTLLLIR